MDSVGIIDLLLIVLLRTKLTEDATRRNMGRDQGDLLNVTRSAYLH